MTYREQVLAFACQGERLLGILSLPGPGKAAADSHGNLGTGRQSRTGVVIIVGGPQYRAGSHRQFVLLARALAAAGFPTLRFDYRGMGDSTGEPRNFEHVDDDIAAAIDALQTAAPQVAHVVLWGLCDGASAALLYCDATHDKRVQGLCLLNPWVRSEASHAKTQIKHYYTQRLRDRAFWLKLLRGQVAGGAVRGVLGNFRSALSANATVANGQGEPPFQHRMAHAWAQPAIAKLLVLSGHDYTAKEFLEDAASSPIWKGALECDTVQRLDVTEADHTFSSNKARALAENRTVEWMKLVMEKLDGR